MTNTSHSTENIKTPHGDTLRELTNAEKSPNYSYLKRLDRIPNTPFDIAEIENQFMGVLGISIITPKFSTVDQVINYIDENMWTVVMSCIAAYDIIKETTKKIAENKKPL